MIIFIFSIVADYDLNAQNLPEDDYDLFDSNYPLQEQKRYPVCIIFMRMKTKFKVLSLSEGKS